MLSTHCMGIKAHLTLRCEFRGVSRHAAGSFGFLSSCDGDLRELPMLTQESQASFQVVMGQLRILLESLQGNRASSRVKAGNSVFLSTCDRDLGVPIKFQQGSQASLPIEAWNFGFLSSCKGVSGLLLS